jgi:hypothetical protein
MAAREIGGVGNVNGRRRRSAMFQRRVSLASNSATRSSAICGSGNRRKNNNSASGSPAKAYRLAAWLHGGKRLAALAAGV